MASNESTEVEKNPYAYLERADFTSEKYKIEVHGLPKYYGIGEFKKLLNEKLDLQSCKIKPPKRSSGWLYVSFRNEESRQKAIETLNGILWKNYKLSAQIAKPAPDPFIKKKLEEENARKRLKVEEDDQSISIEDKVKLTTIPLWNMPYPSQLELKQKEMSSILTTICKQMLKESKGDLLDWLNCQKNKYQGLPCELLPILSIDTIKEYRNKCEFTVGKSDKEDKIVIGFRLSTYASGSTAVGPIDNLCHIPNKMKIVVKVLEEFMKSTELTPFDPVDYSGYWRQVTVRTTLSDHLMVIVGIHPQDLTSSVQSNSHFDVKRIAHGIVINCTLE